MGLIANIINHPVLFSSVLHLLVFNLEAIVRFNYVLLLDFLKKTIKKVAKS